MAGKVKDITGQRFNRLIALRFSHRDQRRSLTYWYFRCDCGTECLLHTHCVRSGNTKSCGCYAREAWSAAAKRLAQPIRDKTGRRYGRWVVLGLNRRDQAKHATFWNCRCDCGTERVITGDRLPKTMSCGCFRAEQLAQRQRVHGFAARDRRGSRHRVYTAWQNMKRRCYSVSSARYHCYGARGIRVCQRWREDFTAFVADLGEPLPGMSLDRRNVNGHYSCGECEECKTNRWARNVRWATAGQQASNKTASVRLTAHGLTKTLQEWSKETGVRFLALWHRLKVYGWSPEKTVDTPPRKKRTLPERRRILAIRRTIIQRCSDPRCRSYPRYGGRGITMCRRWLDDK